MTIKDVVIVLLLMMNIGLTAWCMVLYGRIEQYIGYLKRMEK